eukprot:COSAG06_NODE_49754_length_323_cov_0.727679_1_plen_38_part_01
MIAISIRLQTAVYAAFFSYLTLWWLSWTARLWRASADG